jgi:hypothetical protein
MKYFLVFFLPSLLLWFVTVYFNLTNLIFYNYLGSDKSLAFLDPKYLKYTNIYFDAKQCFDVDIDGMAELV